MTCLAWRAAIQVARACLPLLPAVQVDPACRPSAAQLLAMPYFADKQSWLTPEFKVAQVGRSWQAQHIELPGCCKCIS